jgi:aryl-alcohol dehydrogenase-like predicted oxidoreductase
MAGLALAWLLADDRVAQIVISLGRPNDLASVAEALEHPVTGQQQATIDEAVETSFAAETRDSDYQ